MDTEDKKPNKYSTQLEDESWALVDKEYNEKIDRIIIEAVTMELKT
jgi:hypothetical protein